MSDDMSRRLAGVLGPAGPEVTCEACFEHLDRYVELESAQGDTAAETAIPGMRAHLTGCPACAEEHEGLLALLAADGDG
jgi:hypothetical protein